MSSFFDKIVSIFLLCLFNNFEYHNKYFNFADRKIPIKYLNWETNLNPAPALAGAAPPKNQGNREARSAIYATAAVPIFDHVFFALPWGGSGLKLFQWPS